MSRERSHARQRTYPELNEENPVIGLRAVAAAVRYQGNADHVEPSPTPERRAAAAAVKLPRDSEA